MMIRVRLFARLRDLAGKEEITVEIPAGARVRDLKDALVANAPALSGLIGKCIFAIASEFASEDQEIHPGEEVALLPPVSGG